MQQIIRNSPLIYFLVFLFGSAASALAGIAAGAGGAMPWDQPVANIANSFTGPVAFNIALIGIVALGCLVIFAFPQINEFMRLAVYAVMTIAFLISARNTLASFGMNGALCESEGDLIRSILSAAAVIAGVGAVAWVSFPQNRRKLWR